MEQSQQPQTVNVADLARHPDLPEEYGLELELLQTSIAQIGVQTPITVCWAGDVGDSELWVIDGSRRILACRNLRITEVPACFGGSEDALLQFAIANITERELHPLVEATCLSKIKTKNALTDEDLGKRIGLKRTTVTQRLGLCRLTAEIQREAYQLQPPPKREALLLVSQCKDPEEQKQLWERVKKGQRRSDLREVKRRNCGAQSDLSDILAKAIREVARLTQTIDLAMALPDKPLDDKEQLSLEQIYISFDALYTCIDKRFSERFPHGPDAKLGMH